MAYKKIFKKSTAMSLIRLGHDLKGTEPNLKNDRFTVFIFEENEKLLNDLTEITVQRKTESK